MARLARSLAILTTAALASAASNSSATTHKQASSASGAASAPAAATSTTSVAPAAAAPSATSTSTADRSTWQGEAKIEDPNTECTAYYYPPTAALQAEYPAAWGTADLQHAGVLPSDVALFNAMNASIPNIAPRGTRLGDFTNVTYDTVNDPDCWWTRGGCTTPKLAGLSADISSCPEPNTWGFTLDDGPNCSHNAYYDYLQSIEQKATLFYIGSNVVDWPLEAQRGLADGHEICAHTWSHPYMTSMTNEEAFAELYFSKKAIKQVLGITVTCWRPPYGDVDDRIRYIAKQLGMTTILWKHDTFDGSYPTVTQAEIYQNYQDLIDQGNNGTFNEEGIIVLTHEIVGETMQFSEHFLPQIQAAFKGGVMPVGACQNTTEIYAEGSAYQYPDYAQYVAGTRSIQLAAPTAASTNVAFATGSAVSSAGGATGTASAKGSKTTGAKSGAGATGTGTPSSAGASRRAAGGLLAGAMGIAGFAVALV